MARRHKMWGGRPYKDPGGFYIVPRRAFLEDPLLENVSSRNPFHPWMAWQWMVWAAVYEHGGYELYRDGVVIHLKRGQLLYSTGYLGKAWGWSRGKVSRFLSSLERSGRIRREVPRYSVCTVQMGKALRTDAEARHLGQLITIVHYDPYQLVEFYYGTPVIQTSDRTRTGRGHNTNTDKKDKKGARRERRTATPTTPPGPQKLAPEPATWQAIRGSIKLGIWPNLPAHIQELQVAEALEQEATVPADLRPILNGHALPPPDFGNGTDAEELNQLRELRDRLRRTPEEDQRDQADTQG